MAGAALQGKLASAEECPLTPGLCRFRDIREEWGSPSLGFVFPSLTGTRLIFSNILFPYAGMIAHILRQHLNAFAGVEIDDLNSILA